jgi:hypothetical protein
VSQRAVYKTTNAEYLDRAFESSDLVREALERLTGASSLVARAADLVSSGDLLDNSATDLADFSNRMDSGTFEQIVRAGFTEAMQLAIEKGQPIETFWITATGADFELHICEGHHSVVLFFFVPREEGRKYGSIRAQSRSWVVRVDDDPAVLPDVERTPLGDSIVRIQSSGPGGWPGGDLY